MKRILATLLAAGVLTCCSFAQTAQNPEERGEQKTVKAQSKDMDQAQDRDRDQDQDRDNDAAKRTYTAPNGTQVKITKGPILEFVGPNSATIAWSTNANADSTLWYRTVNATQTQFAQEKENGTTHRVHLKSLQPSTQYVFSFESQSATVPTNEQISRGFQFTTPATEAAAIHEQPAQIYNPPSNPATAASGNSSIQIQGPQLAMVSDRSAQITWSTNARASSIVHYGTDKDNLNQRAEAPWGESTHQVTLKNLNPKTTYYVQVESAQALGSGSGAKSQKVSFQTLAPGASAKLNQPVVPVQ